MKKISVLLVFLPLFLVVSYVVSPVYDNFIFLVYADSGTSLVGMDACISQFDTSTTNYAYESCQQRHTFYAAGRHWVFYTDGDNIRYASSPNGIDDWVVTEYYSTNNTGISRGERLAIWYNDTYVFLSYGHPAVNTPLWMNRGTPNSDGTITWGTEVETVPPDSSYVWREPTIAVDSEGYPWVYYRNCSASEYPYITKSSTNDGTWSTESGFPYQLNASSGDWEGTIIPLTEGKVAILYRPDNVDVTLKCRIWDGSMGSQENATDTAPLEEISAVADGDDVHVGYVSFTGGNISHAHLDYGSGWSTTVVRESATNTTTANIVYGGSEELYLIWACSPLNKTIYYVNYTSGSWDGTYQTWIDASENLYRDEEKATWRRVQNGMLGMALVSGDSSPFALKYSYINITDPGEAPSPEEPIEPEPTEPEPPEPTEPAETPLITTETAIIVAVVVAAVIGVAAYWQLKKRK